MAGLMLVPAKGGPDPVGMFWGMELPGGILPGGIAVPGGFKSGSGTRVNTIPISFPPVCVSTTPW